MTHKNGTSTGNAPRFIISGGGTGGHLFPALAIGQSLRAQMPDCAILFVGAKGRIEMQRVPQYGFEVEGLSISGINRSNPLKNFSLPFLLFGSLWKSFRILIRFRPDVVIGTGGYASAPLLFAAAAMRIPVVIQEQNFFPGLTNRLLARYARKICVAYRGMEAWLPASKIKITGNPVREDLFNLPNREEIYKMTGLDPAAKTLLVLGGSGGARTINEAVLKNISTFADNRIQVLWQTGRVYYDRIRDMVPPSLNKSVKVHPFLEDMKGAYAVADLVVSRAGAITLAELSATGKPSILIPSPNVAADHQVKNAEALVSEGAAVMITDREASAELGNKVLELMEKKDKRDALSVNIKHMARPEATLQITKQIMKLTRIHEAK